VLEWAWKTPSGNNCHFFVDAAKISGKASENSWCINDTIPLGIQQLLLRALDSSTGENVMKLVASFHNILTIVTRRFFHAHRKN